MPSTLPAGSSLAFEPGSKRADVAPWLRTTGKAWHGDWRGTTLPCLRHKETFWAERFSNGPNGLLWNASKDMPALAAQLLCERLNAAMQVDAKSLRDASGDAAIPSWADEEPCESHYIKAKEAYNRLFVYVSKVMAI
ncbi:hypothetical protein V494_01174 [Pseudogymnoascus sp. VKM F-4513 (FW-928)]|nr:hypothetical protein V494_01174 [Pseudogymnoascus sp. VKM F-4513 (FW-928)]